MSVHQTDQGPAIMKLGPHIARLFETCRIMGLPIAYTPAEMEAACVATVKKNPGSGSLKISALIPSIEVELVPQDPTVSVMIAAYDSKKDIIDRNPGKYHQARELSLKVEYSISNRREDVIPAQAKMAANYTAALFAKWRARREGFDDILLLDDGRYVAESSTSNVFAVINGTIITPPQRRVLHGVTRASVLELAPAVGVAVEERDLTVPELTGADEVFATATSVGVWPVVRIDDVTIGDGAIGPITSKLRAKHKEIVAGKDPAYLHWLTFCR
jgi:branched-chain amino acid aminotransferase